MGSQRAEQLREVLGDPARTELFDHRAPGLAQALAAQPVARGLLHPAEEGAGLAEAHLRYAAPAHSNLDGNSVDMDRERASFADNSVKYEATLRFINGQVRTMLDAMKPHNQG